MFIKSRLRFGRLFSLPALKGSGDQAGTHCGVWLSPPLVLPSLSSVLDQSQSLGPKSGKAVSSPVWRVVVSSRFSGDI